MAPDSDDGVWFEALWEIVVTIVGGILMAGILGGAGLFYRRWFRRHQVQEELSRASAKSGAPGVFIKQWRQNRVSDEDQLGATF